MSRKIPIGSSKGRRIDFKEEKVSDDPKIEGKYKVRIVTKSSSASFPDVLRIADKYSAYIEDELRYVIFEELNDDLEDLLDLASGWKVFRFYVDDEVIKRDDVYQIKRALFCEFKGECNGICSQSVSSSNRLGDYDSINSFRLIDSLNNLDLEDMYSVRRVLEKKRWVKKTENSKEIKYVIDLEKLEDEINSKYVFFAKYCDLYNYKKINQEISKIKKQIIIEKEVDEDFLLNDDQVLYIDEEFASENNNLEEQYLVFSEEQMDLLAKKIGKEIEKVLKKLMKEK